MKTKDTAKLKDEVKLKVVKAEKSIKVGDKVKLKDSEFFGVVASFPDKEPFFRIEYVRDDGATEILEWHKNQVELA